jgi:hypothetical protein
MAASICGGVRPRSGIVPNYHRVMKGDRVEVVVDTGGASQTFIIAASRAGRRLDISTVRGMIEVSELTRTGTTVRTGRFMATRVIALVEHPAADLGEEEPVPRRRRPRAAGEQSSLL